MKYLLSFILLFSTLTAIPDPFAKRSEIPSEVPAIQVLKCEFFPDYWDEEFEFLDVSDTEMMTVLTKKSAPFSGRIESMIWDQKGETLDGFEEDMMDNIAIAVFLNTLFSDYVLNNLDSEYVWRQGNTGILHIHGDYSREEGQLLFEAYYLVEFSSDEGRMVSISFDYPDAQAEHFVQPDFEEHVVEVLLSLRQL